MAQSPEANAATSEVIRYDLGWNAINAMLRAGRSLSGHERNCCFLNTGGEKFADVSGAAGLDFADDGRVLSLADWDYDGDVDFWVANRSGPQVRYLQNNLRDRGSKAATHFVAFHLEGVHCNRDAIGTRVTVEIDGSPQHQTQTLRAGEGYLSQSSKWLHFGLGASKTIKQITIHWPTGPRQTVENLSVDRWYTVRQGSAPEAWQPPSQLVPLPPSDFVAPPVSDKARIVLLAPIPLPALTCTNIDNGEISLTRGEGARLVSLWASWCPPCLKELDEWRQHADEFSNAGLEIVALNVDQPDDQRNKLPTLLENLELPFRNAFASEELTAKFDVIQRSLLSRQRPLPIPSSFLIDDKGQLRIVYKGPVSAAVLLRDAALLDSDRREILAAATPFSGKWLAPPGGSTPLQLAVKLIEGGYSDDAERYIAMLADDNSPFLTASLLNLRAAILTDKKQFQMAAKTYTESLKLDSANRQAHIELGSLLLGIRRGQLAEPHFTEVLKSSPNDPELIFKLGVSYMLQGKLDEARQCMRRAIELRPMPQAHWQLAELAVAEKSAAEAIKHYEIALSIDPSMISNANNLAWLLATSDKETQRDGSRAVEVAEQVCRVVGKPTAENLDTLAAAYAEAARYDDAVKAATQAQALAGKDGSPTFLEAIRQRLALYRENKAFHEQLK